MKAKRGIDKEGRAWVRISKGRHVIERAWCVECSSLMTIDEAREAYFAQPSTNGKPEKFSFLCPDDRCRDAFEPTISGVNYHKSAERGDVFVQQPHFRWIEAKAHAALCFLVEACLGAPTSVPRERPPDEPVGRPRQSAPKEHDSIDVFVLPSDADAGSARGRAGDDDDDDDGEDRGRGPDAHGAATARPTRTTRLSRLLNHYKWLAKNRRAFETYLTFGDERMKYGEWFQRFSASTKRRDQRWIGYPARFWWGNAKPRLVGEVWRLEFFDGFVDADGEVYPVALTLSEASLRRNRAGRETLRVLSDARAASRYVTACFLGVLERDVAPDGKREVGGRPEPVAAVVAVART
jgi:hypothetical protein